MAVAPFVFVTAKVGVKLTEAVTGSVGVTTVWVAVIAAPGATVVPGVMVGKGVLVGGASVMAGCQAWSASIRSGRTKSKPIPATKPSIKPIKAHAQPGKWVLRAGKRGWDNTYASASDVACLAGSTGAAPLAGVALARANGTVIGIPPRLGEAGGGVWKGGVIGASSPGVDLTADKTISWPQWRQNRDPGVIAWPQCGQDAGALARVDTGGTADCCAAISAPQRTQNRALVRFVWPHFTHFTDVLDILTLFLPQRLAVVQAPFIPLVQQPWPHSWPIRTGGIAATWLTKARLAGCLRHHTGRGSICGPYGGRSAPAVWARTCGQTCTNALSIIPPERSRSISPIESDLQGSTVGGYSAPPSAGSQTYHWWC